MALFALAAALSLQSQSIDSLQAQLSGCVDVLTYTAAVDCMINRVGGDKVLNFRTDENYDPAVYRVVGMTFRLHKPASPVSTSLASADLFNADLAPVILILLARSKAGGKPVDQASLRTWVSAANRAQDLMKADWPPAGAGTAVPLSQCPDLPARRKVNAACVKRPNGDLAILTPLEGENADRPGWLIDRSASDLPAEVMSRGDGAPEQKKGNR